MYMFEEEKTLVWKVFGMEITPYAGFILIGVLLGVITFCVVSRRLKWTAVLTTLLLAAPLAALGARGRWGYWTVWKRRKSSAASSRRWRITVIASARDSYPHPSCWPS